MHHIRTMIGARLARRAIVLRVAFAAGCAAVVCGCQTDQQLTGVPDTPVDYRMRHPITLSEADRTLKIFVGAGRSSLTPAQSAQVLAFAQNWRSEATGGVIVDLPAGSSNERSSAGAMREIASILVATGVPAQSVAVRNYPVKPGTFAPVRVTYPKVVAQAGPCGLWPENIGPGFSRTYSENLPDWNFGCSTQRNLASMVANPEDLVQPRAETPTYTQRRTFVMERYRQGAVTSNAVLSSGNNGKITSVGQ